jgi:hypothetical protein
MDLFRGAHVTMDWRPQFGLEIRLFDLRCHKEDFRCEYQAFSGCVSCHRWIERLCRRSGAGSLLRTGTLLRVWLRCRLFGGAHGRGWRRMGPAPSALVASRSVLFRQIPDCGPGNLRSGRWPVFRSDLLRGFCLSDENPVPARSLCLPGLADVLRAVRRPLWDEDPALWSADRSTRPTHMHDKGVSPA